MSFFSDLARAAGEFVGGAVDAAEEVIDTVTETAEDVVEAVTDTAEDAAEVVVDTARGVVKGASDFGRGVIAAGGEVIETAGLFGESLAELGGRIVSEPGQLADDLLTNVGLGVGAAIENLGETITEFGKNAGDKANDAIVNLQSDIDFFGKQVAEGVDNAGKQIRETFEDVKSGAEGLIEDAGEVVSDAVEAGLAGFEKGKEFIGDALQAAGDGIADARDAVLDTSLLIGRTIGNKVEDIVGELKDAGEEFKKGFEDEADIDLDAGVSTASQGLTGDKKVAASLQSSIEEFKDRLADGSLVKFELPEELPPSIVEKLKGLDPVFGMGDKIDLSGIDAMMSKAGDQAFRFVEAGGKMGAGQLTSYFNEKSGMTVVEAHTNNDGVADFMMEMKGDLDLTKHDFVL